MHGDTAIERTAPGACSSLDASNFLVIREFHHAVDTRLSIPAFDNHPRFGALALSTAMAARCAQFCTPQRLVCFLVISCCISASVEAHRSLQQPRGQTKAPKDKTVKSNAPEAKFDNVDDVTGQPMPPTGFRKDFKKNGDAKQFLTRLGPDLVEQIVVNSNNLGKDTTLAGIDALLPLLESQDDLVSCSS
jgi:hypothetical protein